MSDSILDRYATRSSAGDAETGEAEQLEDLGSFGYLRGVHDRAIFLELRFKSGDMIAFPYSLLTRVDFNRSEGITLRFAGTTVRITGQNLDAEVRPNLRLLTGILRNRVPWIREASSGAAFHSSSAVIERLVLDG